MPPQIDITVQKAYTYIYDNGRLRRQAECTVTPDNPNYIGHTSPFRYRGYYYDPQIAS